MFDGEFSEYLKKLASSSATPGGGAAAAVAGAQGCALLAMVSELSVDKKKLVEFCDEHKKLLAKFEKSRIEFLHLATEDIRAFSKVMATYKLEKGDSSRNANIQNATLEAAGVALRTAGLVSELWGDIERLKVIGNPSVITDVACGYYQLVACFDSSLINIKINLNSLDSGEDREKITLQLANITRDRLVTDFEI